MQPPRLMVVSTASAPPLGTALTQCLCGHSDFRAPCPIMTAPHWGFRGLRRSDSTKVTSGVRGGFERLSISLPPEGAGALQSATRKPFPQKCSLMFLSEYTEAQTTVIPFRGWLLGFMGSPLHLALSVKGLGQGGGARRGPKGCAYRACRSLGGPQVVT